MALVAAGMDPGLVERLLPLVGVEASDSGERVAERVEGLAVEVPALFGEAGAPAVSRREGSAHGSSRRDTARGLRPVESDGGGSAEERARARFEASRGRPPGGDAA
jgi:hypothetical protein